jgi:hypothetical protein
MSTMLREDLVKKWAPVLEHETMDPIKDQYRKEVTAVLLENQQKSLSEERAALFEAVPTNANYNGSSTNPDTGGVAKYDPILISLVRRAAPQMIAYDVCGVQPMTGPTGLVFAMKARYGTQGGTEAGYNEANAEFAGGDLGTDVNQTAISGSNWFSTANAPGGMTTQQAEGGHSASSSVAPAAVGPGSTTFNEMAFSIEKTSVTAKSRALKAEYSIELAQDLKAVHGLDAESELSNILSTEILAEINREVIRTIYYTAKSGAASGTVTTAGVFDLDTDANGRWSVEKFKGLLFQIERDANVIAQETRRGKGNFIICSSDVASSLAMAGVLDYAPALNTNLNVDDAGSTFAGVLNGRYRVYIDPYAANGGANDQFYVVGYKGSSAFDAGIFYCPYVPLQMVRAVDPNTFQPKIGFKTRYGMIANPFARGTTLATSIGSNENVYYRRVRVQNIM